MPFIQMISFQLLLLYHLNKDVPCALDFGSWFLYSGTINLVPLNTAGPGAQEAEARSGFI